MADKLIRNHGVKLGVWPGWGIVHTIKFLDSPVAASLYDHLDCLVATMFLVYVLL